VLRHEADLLREQLADPDETGASGALGSFPRLRSGGASRVAHRAWVINTGFEAFGVLLAAVVLMTLREE